MNNEDIIRMALKAGIAKYGLGWTCWEGQLERFASSIEAAVIAKLPGRGYYHEGFEAGAAAEREECVKMFDGKEDQPFYGRHVAAAIRARGQQ